MTTLKDAIVNARVDAQQLHRSIGESTAKNHATVRTELLNAGDRARDLAASLKEVVDAQETDTKQHVKDATSALEETAKSAKSIAGSADSDLKAINGAMLVSATTAVHHLSKAVAAKRASKNLVKR